VKKGDTDKMANRAHIEASSPTPSAPYSRRIVFALRKIMQQMDFHSRNLDKQYGITVPQLVCLYEIYEKGVMTISVLSKNVHLSSSTLVGIIDRLEEKGFVRRTRDTEDRRVTFIDITEKGKEFVGTSPHLLHNRLDEHFKALSEAEQIIIANSLDLLVDMLKNS
jgi:DNA-binding MarR family transcriptional regulator